MVYVKNDIFLQNLRMLTKEEETRLTSNEALQLLEKESQRILSEKICPKEEAKETETETNMKDNLVHKFQAFLIYNDTRSKLGSYKEKLYHSARVNVTNHN
jgi:hypothetical protein